MTQAPSDKTVKFCTMHFDDV